MSLLPKCSQLPARGRFPHPASPLPPPDAKRKLETKSIGGEGAGTLVGRGVITAQCPAGFCLGLADVGVCQIPAPIRKNKRQNFPKPPGEPALSCCQFISSSSLNLTTEMGSITAPQNKFFEEKKEQEGISGELQAPTFQRKPLQRPLRKADTTHSPREVRGGRREAKGEIEEAAGPTGTFCTLCPRSQLQLLACHSGAFQEELIRLLLVWTPRNIHVVSAGSLQGLEEAPNPSTGASRRGAGQADAGMPCRLQGQGQEPARRRVLLRLGAVRQPQPQQGTEGSALLE